MPYSTNRQLPKGVKRALPKHGQDIYRKAFNQALSEYHNEIQAHKVAWSAVEKLYSKPDKNGKWSLKNGV